MPEKKIVGGVVGGIGGLAIGAMLGLAIGVPTLGIGLLAIPLTAVIGLAVGATGGYGLGALIEYFQEEEGARENKERRTMEKEVEKLEKSLLAAYKFLKPLNRISDATDRISDPTEGNNVEEGAADTLRPHSRIRKHILANVANKVEKDFINAAFTYWRMQNEELRNKSQRGGSIPHISNAGYVEGGKSEKKLQLTPKISREIESDYQKAKAALINYKYNAEYSPFRKLINWIKKRISGKEIPDFYMAKLSKNVKNQPEDNPILHRNFKKEFKQFEATFKGENKASIRQLAREEEEEGEEKGISNTITSTKQKDKETSSTITGTKQKDKKTINTTTGTKQADTYLKEYDASKLLTYFGIWNHEGNSEVNEKLKEIAEAAEEKAETQLAL